jgi:hypothetical protein
MIHGNHIEVVKAKDAKKRYVFSSNGSPVAELDFPKRFAKAAVATVGKNKWNIRRTGWWHHYYEISTEQSPYTKWKVKQGWRSDLELRSDDNRRFFLRKKGFWKTSWVWSNDQNEELIEMYACQWPGKKPGSVTFRTNHPDSTHLWLVLVGWFVLLCSQEDAAAVAAAA